MIRVTGSTTSSDSREARYPVADDGPGRYGLLVALLLPSAVTLGCGARSFEDEHLKPTQHAEKVLHAGDAPRELREQEASPPPPQPPPEPPPLVVVPPRAPPVVPQPAPLPVVTPPLPSAPVVAPPVVTPPVVAPPVPPAGEPPSSGGAAPIPVPPEEPMSPAILQPLMVSPTDGTCDAPVQLGSGTGNIYFASNNGRADRYLLACGGEGGGELIFQWTAPSTGLYEFHTLGSTYDTVLALSYPGDCLSTIRCEDDYLASVRQSVLLEELEGGTTVNIIADAFSAEDNGELQLTINALEDPQLCPSVETGSGIGVGPLASGSFLTDAVERQQGEVQCGGGVRSVTVNWTAHATASYRFRTVGSEFDTVLSVRRRCNSRELGCNDDDSQDGTSSLQLSAREGASYILDIRAYDDVLPSNSNSFYALDVLPLDLVQ